jgi:hypothetical protein
MSKHGCAKECMLHEIIFLCMHVYMKMNWYLVWHTYIHTYIHTDIHIWPVCKPTDASHNKTFVVFNSFRARLSDAPIYMGSKDIARNTSHKSVGSHTHTHTHTLVCKTRINDDYAFHMHKMHGTIGYAAHAWDPRMKDAREGFIKLVPRLAHEVCGDVA